MGHNQVLSGEAAKPKRFAQRIAVPLSHRYKSGMLRILFCLLVVLWISGCATPKPEPRKSSKTQRGIASWYGGEFIRTASGERYDPNSMTAAHRTLPFGTKVKVTSLRTKQTVIVRINNRGPYSRGRIIDVSKAAARQLQMMGSGIAQVEIEVL